MQTTTQPEVLTALRALQEVVYRLDTIVHIKPNSMIEESTLRSVLEDAGEEAVSVGMSALETIVKAGIDPFQNTNETTKTAYDQFKAGPLEPAKQVA